MYVIAIQAFLLIKSNMNPNKLSNNFYINYNNSKLQIDWNEILNAKFD